MPMKTQTPQAVARLSKAMKHARQLRSSLDKLVYLLPDAHQAWHTMADEIRCTEQYLETMLEMIQEMLERDPSTYAEIFLSPETTEGMEATPDSLLTIPHIQLKPHLNDILPCIVLVPRPPYGTST